MATTPAFLVHDRDVKRVWRPRGDLPGGRRTRQVYEYHAYVPRKIAAVDPVLAASTVEQVRRAEDACRALNEDPPTLLSLEAVARQLLRAEAVASSRIEGLVLSHKRLAEAAFVRERHDPDARAVLANVLAVERGIELVTAAPEVSVGLLVEVHRVLFEGTRDERLGGQIREQQNWIGGYADGPRGAVFVPPPEDLVPGLLADLCEFCNRDDLSPALQAAVAHAQFETIHPFLDGNGRVGRALIHILLRRRGSAPRYVPPLSLVLAGWADRYVHGLTDYREDAPESWLTVFAEALERSALAAHGFAEKVSALQEQWLEQAGRPRPQSVAHKLVALLPAHPVVDLSTVRTITGATSEAVRQAILRLERAGVLVEVRGVRRNRVWESVGLFALLDGLERDLGPEGRTPRRQPTSAGSAPAQEG